MLEKVYGGWVGQKKVTSQEQKGAGDGGDRLNPNGFHSDALCRILAAACGSTPARASGTLFEARQSEITYSICIRSNYTPEPFYRFTFTVYFFFSTMTLQHTIMYPLIQKDIDLQIFLSLRNFAHTVQCAYNDM